MHIQKRRAVLCDRRSARSDDRAAYRSDAVIIALTYEGNFSGITKIIYPELAKKYNRTIQSVERNLRSIIGAAWRNRTEHGKYSIMGKVFSRCPTNSEVVFTIADIIKIERAAGEETRI